MENNDLNNKIKKRKLIINIVGLLVFLLICVVVTILIFPYIKNFLKDPIAFKEYIKENGFVGGCLFILVQILQIIVSVIPGEVVEIAGGISFGWFFGLLLCELGVAIGTIIIFIVCKKFGRSIIDIYLGEGKLKRFDKLDKNPKRDNIIFLLFLIPGLPKDMLIYACAFFDISLSRFLLISLIARIPSIITSTIAGELILQKNYASAVIIFIITGAIALMGYLLYEKKRKAVEK